MKKNNSKAAGSAALDRQARRESEDRSFNKMMVWLCAAAVTEIFFVVVNRFFIHARAGEAAGLPMWSGFLLVMSAAGIVLFVICFAMGWKKRKEGSDAVLPWALGAAFLTAGVGCFIVRGGGQTAMRLVLAAVPGLAVLSLVFYLYQREFFSCVLTGELGILALLIFRSAGGFCGTYLAALLLAAAVGALCTWFHFVRRKKGGAEKRPAGGDMNWLACGVTAAVAVVLLLCPVFLGGAIAYYGIWALGAWLFILAVYFTSKLM